MQPGGKRVIVVGATGIIGRPLCRILQAAGYELVVFSRDPAAARRLVPDASEYVAWQAEERGDWVSAVDGAWAVVNMAGAPFFACWNAAYKREVSASRQRATRGLIYAMSVANVKPQVFIGGGSIGFYGFMDKGNQKDKELDERQPVGNDWWGRDSLQLEEEILCAEDIGVRTVVIRTGIILDAGAGALGGQLERYQKGQGSYIRPGDQWYSWIHVEDEAELIRFALEDERVRGALNATAPYPERNREFFHILGELLGKPVNTGLPGFVLRLFLGEVATVVIHGRRVMPAKAQELGYKFKYAHAEEALRDLLAVRSQQS